MKNSVAAGVSWLLPCVPRLFELCPAGSGGTHRHIRRHIRRPTLRHHSFIRTVSSEALPAGCSLVCMQCHGADRSCVCLVVHRCWWLGSVVLPREAAMDQKGAIMADEGPDLSRGVLCGRKISLILSDEITGRRASWTTETLLAHTWSCRSDAEGASMAPRPHLLSDSRNVVRCCGRTQLSWDGCHLCKP